MTAKEFLKSKGYDEVPEGISRVDKTHEIESLLTEFAALPTVFACKKIRAGKYEYRGWIISCVGYYEPERRVCWEAYDPKTGWADFHGFSKKEIKWLIDESLSKNGR